jgi:hypothetical protein
LKRIRTVKQVRLNINDHSVTVGFYDTPTEETLNQIKTDVHAELSREWDVSIKADDKLPTVHLHKIGSYTTHFHRAHPSVIRNRPLPRPVPRDYRVMLLLAATCGLSTLAGFLFGRAGIRGCADDFGSCRFIHTAYAPGCTI